MFLIASAFAQNQGSGGVAALKPGASNTSANIFVQANNSAAPFSLQPPINQVNGRRTSVTASGIVTVAGSSPTFNISFMLSVVQFLLHLLQPQAPTRLLLTWPRLNPWSHPPAIHGI